MGFDLVHGGTLQDIGFDEQGACRLDSSAFHTAAFSSIVPPSSIPPPRLRPCVDDLALVCDIPELQFSVALSAYMCT
ncbi:hypothetical protein [Tsukamurella tyrosinosolvens]|uniref:hypothetical protein n=1 Tax=Tsukamurella tyrosinosolvens TaxID=57704 RepID=UPI000793FFBE|nr:hypothetical protein [Tsukamurella tyrosinosolvens]KXO92756.1 hypothetical protein AXK58_19360 [Tsukamurella tyrosinosolvens]